MTSRNENGQKILEMLELYESLTPNLRPNLIPPNLKLNCINQSQIQQAMGENERINNSNDDVDMMEEESKGGENLIKDNDSKDKEFLSIFTTKEQIDRVKKLMLKNRKKYATNAKINKADSNIYFVYETKLDLYRGLVILQKVRYTNQIENNLLSIPTIINMSTNNNNTNINSNFTENDFSLHAQHFLGINGHDVNDLATFQQIYSLAYAIRTCISHLPIKFSVALDDDHLLMLPIEGEENEERIVNSLFSI